MNGIHDLGGMTVGEGERDDAQHPTRGFYESWLELTESASQISRIAPA